MARNFLRKAGAGEHTVTRIRPKLFSCDGQLAGTGLEPRSSRPRSRVCQGDFIQAAQRRPQAGKRGGNHEQVGKGNRRVEIGFDAHRLRQGMTGQEARVLALAAHGIDDPGSARPQCNLVANRKQWQAPRPMRLQRERRSSQAPRPAGADEAGLPVAVTDLSRQTAGSTNRALRPSPPRKRAASQWPRRTPAVPLTTSSVRCSRDASSQHPGEAAFGIAHLVQPLRLTTGSTSVKRLITKSGLPRTEGATVEHRRGFDGTAFDGEGRRCREDRGNRD